MTDIFAMIADERRILADEVEKFTDAQWNTASAMPGWKVHHVVAHLVWPLEASMVGTVFLMIRNGFNFNKVADSVVAKDTRSRQELAGILRARAEHKFVPPGAGPEAPLTDAVVHGLDLRLPLGLKRDLPKDRALIVLDNVVKPGNAKFFGAPTGFTFSASDVGWTSGSGPRVEGTSTVLMHALTGRKVGLDTLTGDGASAFRGAFKEYQ